jgi:hypothetical protein
MRAGEHTGRCRYCGHPLRGRLQMCTRCRVPSQQYDAAFKSARVRWQTKMRHLLCRTWLELRRIRIDLAGPQGWVPLDLLMRLDGRAA